jgi:uncharacterized membrane protein
MSEDTPSSSLEQRVSDPLEQRVSDPLEQRVSDLERRLAAMEQHAPPPFASPTARAAAAARHASPPPQPMARAAAGTRSPWWSGDSWLEQGEGWLGRAGVGLVVLGFVFLYRYAVERGWLTPEARIGVGLLVGLVMLGAGAMRFQDRRRFRQILMGGGVVILFITGIAATELYGLVRGGIALLFHGAVAGTAFIIASRQREPVMASIGAVGSLVPPALLLHGSAPGPALWLYLVLMVGWSGVLAAARPWGTFALIAGAAAVVATFRGVPAEPAARAAAGLLLVAVWIFFAALPLLRGRLKWAASLPPAGDMVVAHLFALPLLVTAGLAIAAEAAVWPDASALQYAFAAAAAGFAAVAVWLHRSRPPATAEAGSSLTRPHFTNVLTESDAFAAALAAAVLSLSMAATAAFEPAIRFLPVAALAALALLSAGRLRAPVLVPVAHLLFAAIAVEFWNRIAYLYREPAFDAMALGFAGVALLALVLVRVMDTRAEQWAYGAAGYAAVHVLLATELSAVPGAAWLGSASYAAVGSGLVIIGLRRQQLVLQRAGLLSLALLVIRLFAFDLANSGVGVRIALFMLCGFAFLGLSYLFRGRRPGVDNVQ